MIGRFFQRGGKLGFRPKSVDKLYDELAAANLKQASDRHVETKEERQRRLKLLDATRAVSALLYVRTYTKSYADRQSLMREVVDITKDALKPGATPSQRAKVTRFRKKAEARKKKTKQLQGVTQ